MNLTEKYIAKLEPKATRQQILDDETSGLLIRVEPSGRKLFGWYRKVANVPRYRALGESPETTLADARIEAEKLNAKVAEWKRTRFAEPDPFAKVAAPPKATAAPTFMALVEAYIKDHVRLEANRPDKAEADLRWLMRKHLPTWLDRPLDSITIADVASVKNALGNKEQYHSANRVLAMVKAIFSWCAGASPNGGINFYPLAENPAKRVLPFGKNQTGQPRARILSAAELVRFEAALADEQCVDLRDFLVLALKTGVRKDNILSMRWQDVSFEQTLWHIPLSKSGEGYAVQLLPAALDVLQRRRATAPEDATFVFPGIGTSGHLENIDKQYYAFRERAGIGDVRLHDLRRTCGSLAAQAGASLPAIGAMLGHRSLSATAIYARWCDKSIRETREAAERKAQQMMSDERKRQEVEARPRPVLVKQA
jgi:integrase